jgi:hypothetical protein
MRSVYDHPQQTLEPAMDTQQLARALVTLEDAGTTEHAAFEAFLRLSSDPRAILMQGAVLLNANRAKLEALREVMRLAEP